MIIKLMESWYFSIENPLIGDLEDNDIATVTHLSFLYTKIMNPLESLLKNQLMKEKLRTNFLNWITKSGPQLNKIDYEFIIKTSKNRLVAFETE